MDSFIFKGKSSEEFKIIVNSLPSISKPTLRVEEIEIDGVDGTRYEELGYGSYDKKIKITITEDNIDSLIGWLKEEGDLILSNEPDKYYKAKIIDQINFSRLMKYEPTEITFRVQPFKYEYQEEEQITATGSTEGTNIKITDAKATQLQVDGRSTQETRSSKNKLKFSSNRQPGFSESTGGLTFTINEDYSIIVNGTNNGENSYIYILIGETLSLPAGTYIGGLYNDDFHLMSYDGTNAYSFNNVTTLSSDITLLDTYIEINSDSKGKTFNNVVLKPIIVSGDSLPIEWEPYGFSPSPDYPSEIESVGYENLYKPTLIADDGSTILVGNGIAELNDDIFKLTAVGNNLYLGQVGFVDENYDVVKGNLIDVSDYDSIYYKLSNTLFTNNYITYYDENLVSLGFIEYSGSENIIDLSNAPSRKKYISFRFGYPNATIGETYETKIQVYKGSVAHPYIPYGKYGVEVKTTNQTDTNTTLIILDEPLRSLPNGVKDIAFIRNNKLYVDRYVGSVVLDGSEIWSKSTGYSNDTYFCGYLQTGFTSNIVVDKDGYNNRFKIGVYDSVLTEECMAIRSQLNVRILANRLTENSVDAFKTWLSTHNTQVDYELATPVTEEYGDLTILELVDGENNISNSADANMIVDYVDNKLIINNLGNYVSKPTLEIEGAGTIKFILNGYSVFTYTFDADGRVVIDSEKEDAYLDTVLKNRNMNGEFPKLEIGENIITWEGLIKSIKVVKKSRWL